MIGVRSIWPNPLDPVPQCVPLYHPRPPVSISSCQRNLMETYHNEANTKGQLISKCPFGVIVWTKIATKKFDNFCPGGQIKKKDNLLR